MKATINGVQKDIRAVWFEDGRVMMIDQRKLPGGIVIVGFDDYLDVAEAIRNMTTRGAPSIGATAAYGMCIAALKGCDVVVCVNKVDLADGEPLADIYRQAGLPTVCTSAETGEGITELISLISGKLSAFTGNSGVGKSSILNAIEPGFSLRVDAVSEKLGRGKHTTRHVELFQLSCGAEVIDTPGFSSFEAEELGLPLKEHLPECFVEFRPYLDKCRFVGCSHTREKGCAVLQAVRAGEIPASRHQSYLRLCQELKDLKAWNANPGQNPAYKNR